MVRPTLELLGGFLRLLCCLELLLEMLAARRERDCLLRGLLHHGLTHSVALGCCSRIRVVGLHTPQTRIRRALLLCCRRGHRARS